MYACSKKKIEEYDHKGDKKEAEKTMLCWQHFVCVGASQATFPWEPEQLGSAKDPTAWQPAPMGKFTIHLRLWQPPTGPGHSEHSTYTQTMSAFFLAPAQLSK